MKKTRIFALLLALLLALTSFGLAEEMLDTEFTFEIEGEEPAAPEIAPELPEEVAEEEVDMTPKSVESDFDFSFAEDGSRVLLQYYGKDANVVIPKEWNVSIIDEKAFAYNSIRSITLPATVKTIGKKAFYDCFSLKTVKLSEGLEEIGYEAFSECISLTSIKLPKSLKALGAGAFMLTGLTSIAIPEGITEVSYETFYQCFDLKSVTLPKSIQVIDEGAFYFCTSLTSIKLPEGLTYIGEGAFMVCKSLKSVKIPNSVKAIDRYTFDYCTSLTSVTLPKSLETIGFYAFMACTKLKSIVIPDTVKYIDNAFVSCSSLTSVTMPANLEGIETDAFRYVPEDAKFNVFPGSLAETFANYCGFTIAYRKDYALAAQDKNRECYINDVIDMTAFVSTPAEPSGAIYALKSSSAKVLTVDNEALTAKAIAEGSATLTATMTIPDPKNAAKTLAKKTASMKVKVLDPNKLSAVLIEGEATRSMTVGQKLALNAVTVPNVGDISCTWKSSKAAVASVDANGEVTAVKKGSATITVTATQGKVKKTASTKINVADVKPIVITITDLGGKPFENNELYLSNRGGIESCFLTWTDGNNGFYRDKATVKWHNDNGISLRMSDTDTPETLISVQENGEATVTLTVTIDGKEYTADLKVYLEFGTA